MAPAARGQVLIPWPNRLAGGLYRFGEQTHQLPLSEPALSNAIHGLVRWSAWDLIDASPRGVRLGHVLWPQAGYPFTLALELLYELSDLGLRVTMHDRFDQAGHGIHRARARRRRPCVD
jgi:aldose 1-epimerase